MGYIWKGAVGAIFIGALGVFLIWKGITGDVIRTSLSEEFIPRWVYILGGLVVLILPVTFLLVVLDLI